MKMLLKACAVIVVASAVVVGVLVFVDSYLNKNRLKGDYLNCEAVKDYE